MWTNLKPAVAKRWLFILSGLMWGGVGVLLDWLAVGWLSAIDWRRAALLGGVGAAMALATYYFGFTKIVQKNIERLCLLADRVCLFAFQGWKGYLMIGVMMPMGIVLRHSSFPKHYLAVLYLAMGGALFLASFHYFYHFWRIAFLKEPCLLEDEYR